MDRLKASLTAKTAAVILVIVSLLALVISACGMLAIDQAGGYRMRKEDLLHKAYESICDQYAVAAMAVYLDEDLKELYQQQLTQSNFRYGIVKAKSRSKADFRDPDSYVDGNIEQLPDNQELYYEEFDFGKEVSFRVDNDDLWNTYIDYSMPYEEQEYVVNGWYYDPDSDAFYVRAENKLFPISEGTMISADDEEYTLDSVSRFIEEVQTENGTAWQWVNCLAVLIMEDLYVDINDIRILDGTLDRLEDYGKVQQESPDYFFDGGRFLTRQELPTEHYIVVSYVNLPLAGTQTWMDGDPFVKATLLMDLIYQIRYIGIVALMVSLVIFAASFAFLMAAAGHRKGQDDVQPHFLDFVPLDLHFAGVVLVETAVFFLTITWIEATIGWRRNDLSGMVSAFVMATCAGVFAVLFAISWCMSFAVHVKLGLWWKHTLVSMALKKCMRLCSKMVYYSICFLRGFCRSIPLFWKVWLVLGILAFIEFAAMQSSWVDANYKVFWVMEKMVLYPLIIVVLVQLRRLQKGACQIANGQLDYQIDTRLMFWEIKKHGDYLNDIGKGMNNAVNERMKSERFKTELITNVSHDIKTPLTSIINYVDLLQKEEIANPIVQEYLEVLHRQSGRLKKLIEDLMEASKASSGSLSVVMEKCDAGVMLVQTVGEFEEKLMKEQIELQIKKPETDLSIEADHRHLWRVFDNLMNNICKYAQPSTRAYVNLEQNGQQAVITFRNISKYQLNISSEELMERFVRGDSSRNTEGSGLGISIAKSLTELMDGTFALVVDGDLFKVVLTFPLYGSIRVRENQADEQQADQTGESGRYLIQKESCQKDAGMLDGLAAGVRQAGAYAAGVGYGMADKTGRMFWRAGRFAHHVRHAARQVQEEEAAQMQKEKRAEGETAQMQPQQWAERETAQMQPQTWTEREAVQMQPQTWTEREAVQMQEEEQEAGEAVQMRQGDRKKEEVRKYDTI